MGSEDIASYLQASNEAGRNVGGLQEKECTIMTKQLEDFGFAAADRKMQVISGLP